jgi:hypothetical protein
MVTAPPAVAENTTVEPTGSGADLFAVRLVIMTVPGVIAYGMLVPELEFSGASVAFPALLTHTPTL